MTKARLNAWMVATVALASLAACGDTGANRDSGTYTPPIRPDGSPTPDYRTGRCGEGGVGSGDGGVCEGGVPPIVVDAGPPPPPCNEHTFEYRDTSASTVWVSGSFNDWATMPSEGALILVNDGSGLFSLTTLVEPTGRHEYKFVVDGTTWVPDPNNPERVDDTFGSFNSVIYLCTTACGDVDSFDWRDAVMYFAMVDRFQDSDGSNDPVSGAAVDGVASAQYEGGDLAGVTENLGYLSNLGVTAIWLSAPYENRNTVGAAIDPGSDSHLYSGYHGYWPSPANIDYSVPTSPSPRPQVESRIGVESELRNLIDSAHATTGADGHGMKVLFDYVMNHVDIDSGLYAAHNDWFARRGGSFALCGPENLWNDPYWGTRCAFTDYLPPFDFDNALARAWSVNDALWWAQEFGIDGYRLDAIKHVPLSWLTDLRARLNAEIAEPEGGRFYLVGETFAYDDPGLIRSFVDPSSMLDGQFDFPFKARLCEAVFTAGGRLDTFSSWMDGNDGFYGPESIMTTWIGNHDIPRVIHFASRQIGNCREGSNAGNGWNPGAFAQPTDAVPYERLGVAFAIMMTSPGIPLIYYGDEIGLAGGGDPDNRRMLPAESALNAHQRALRNRVSELAAIRGAEKALTRGTRTQIAADQDTWVYRMSASGCGPGIGDVVVAINRADGTHTVDIPVGVYDDLMGGGRHSGGSTSLPARSYLLLGER